MRKFYPLVLWAYRTSKRTPTQATPFSHIYGAEVVVLVEIVVPSSQMALASNITDSQDRVHDVKAIDEKRQKAENRWSTYQKRINKLTTN